MSFENFFKCVNDGIKRDIKSRRLKMKVSVDEFSTFSNKYFKNINDKDLSFKFVVDEVDKNSILFVLRSFFNMYVEINENSIIIFKNFPKKFILLKEVNKSNHYFTPRTFKKGTIMYSISPSYSSTNRMNGVPLWDSLETIEETELVPSVQINYDYIKPYTY
tara:strand:+ start:320 stop:805 length:486 start_codon:yes stop_codon:yes gene_type:complete